MSTLAKVLLGLAIAIVGSIAMLTFSGLYIAHHVRVQERGSEGGKTVDIATPLGALSVHENKALDPASVGIPIYPGAMRSDDHGGADFEIDAGNLHESVTVAGATYLSEDPPDKVRAFYEDKFPGWHSHWHDGEIQIETKDGFRKRFISIKRDGDRTRIGLAAIGPPAAN